MSALTPDEQRALYNEIMRPRYSRSPLRHVGEGTIGNIETLEENMDGSIHVLVMWVLAAYLKSPDHIALLHEVADNTDPNRQWDAKLAQAILNKIAQMDASVGCPVAGTPTGAHAAPEAVPTPTYSAPDPAPKPDTPLIGVPPASAGLHLQLATLRDQINGLSEILNQFLK